MANLVGKVPPLEASGAAVTLVHPTATTVVGQWDVTYPQDMPEEQRPNLGPTRTFGYAHRLVEKPPRFARRHVRRDVQIDARDKNGWSNAESQIDSAARELSGDVVFQRTLTGDDLGALVPNVDFKQGDVLPLMVWGMIVPATCTSIRYTLEDGKRTVEVGFGPSLTADRDGLAESMSQIDRQMRAEAAGIDEYLAKQLDEAKAASKEQVDGLKTYVDDQDKEVKKHASSEASNALTSAKKDAKTKADAAETRAKNYAKKQDEALLKSANAYADNAAQKELDKAREAIDDYRQQVTEKIGEQGTITKDLANLNRDYEKKLGANGTVLTDLRKLNRNYTKLSNDFTAKVGENGTLVRDQNNTANVLDAMINGTAHKQLTGSQFQQQQNAVNLMQSEFNKKQVGINTGFQNLFKAQDDINQVNSAFQKKQYDLNTGFQRLFEAQAYTNSLQLAFNKKQTGINTVYDAMWEEQNKRDLSQEYLIAYNEIMADAFTPKLISLMYNVDDGQMRLSRAHPNQYTDRSETLLMDQALINIQTNNKVKIIIPTNVRFRGAAYMLSVDVINGHGHGFMATVVDTNRHGHKGLYGISVELPVDNPTGDEQVRNVSVSGVVIPMVILPQYQESLDDLKAKYRKKGLKV